jgi:hypothetical protein
MALAADRTPKTYGAFLTRCQNELLYKPFNEAKGLHLPWYYAQGHSIRLLVDNTALTILLTDRYASTYGEYTSSDISQHLDC